MADKRSAGVGQESRLSRIPTRREKPVLLVTVKRAAHAPTAPSARTLTQLFSRALEVRPEPCGQQGRGKRRQGAALQERWAVDVHIVTDARMAALNLAHLKLRGATDVLAFAMGEPDPERRAFNLGEIVVSYETAQREATARGLAVEEELGRYCLHGLLHLLGYEDQDRAARKAMLRVQEALLLEAKARGA